MDEVLHKFGTVMVDSECDDDGTSEYKDLYKNWGKFGNQEERRKQILERQKSNRNSNFDGIRGILKSVENDDAMEIYQETNQIIYRPNIYVAGFHSMPLSYKNVLMYSEWMIEKPEDFSENWFVVPCPKGVRLLVVARKGITKCYTKHGKFKYEFRTGLPGGNPRDKSRRHCCVLDCFYHENTNTMYILDLLAWNSQPMCDGETDFRHFWLQSQLAELEELKQITKQNTVIFSLLPKITCTPDALDEFMMQYPVFPNNNPELDGLLFYHKKAHYVSGETPLVGWLYPYMVPEVIGRDVKISPLHYKEKPKRYISQAAFIENLNQANPKKEINYYSKEIPKKYQNKDNKAPFQIKTNNKHGAKSEKCVKMDDEPIEENQNQVTRSVQAQT